MNKISGLLVSGALLIGLAIAAPAEWGHHGGGQRGGSPLERMKSTLNLTDDQVAKLQPTFDQIKSRHESQRQAMEAKMKTILTPEQQQKMADARAEHKRGGFRDLNLSDDQKAQMKAFWESQKGTMTQDRSQIDAQMQATLTPDQLTKYNEMKAKMKEGWGKRGGGRHHGPRPDSSDDK